MSQMKLSCLGNGQGRTLHLFLLSRFLLGQDEKKKKNREWRLSSISPRFGVSFVMSRPIPSSLYPGHKLPSDSDWLGLTCNPHALSSCLRCFHIFFFGIDGGAGAGDAGSRDRCPRKEPETLSNIHPICLHGWVAWEKKNSSGFFWVFFVNETWKFWTWAVGNWHKGSSPADYPGICSGDF